MKKLATILLVLLVATGIASAQLNTGSISGSVIDATGAAIPGADVIAKNVDAGGNFQTVSSEAGLYVFPSLPLGLYELTVERTGFKKLTRGNIEVRLAARLSLDLQLEVGDVQQTVEVTSSAPLLVTVTSERGDGASVQMMQTLPLFTGGIGRGNAFTQYMPGVNTAAGQVSVNGSGGRAKEVLIEGASLTIPESGGVVFNFPASEMFGEFKLVTSTYAAENGRFGGGIEIFNAKSGVNTFHGAGYWNVRNDVFNAAGYAVNRAGGTRPINRFNVAGGSGGGPVRVPGYDGRNKTFWYFTWVKDLRPGSQNSVTSSVPTALLKQGDFSQYTAAGQLIYDPLTTAGNVRDPFVNQQIPTSRFSNVSKNILPFLPDPNTAGLGDNLSFLNSSVLNNTIWSIKLDHAITDNLRVSYFQTDENSATDSFTALPGPLGQGLTDNGTKPRYIRSNADWVISPTTLLHSTFGYSITKQSWNNRSQQGFASQIGLPASSDATPRVRFEGADNLTAWGVQDGKVDNGFQNNVTYHMVQGLTTVKGNHEYKVGWDIRYLQTTAQDAAGTNGLYNFARAQTALPTNRSGTGHSFASFLLGSPDSAETTALPIPDIQIRYSYYSGYFQDNWKITPRFTANLGIRYEVPIGWHMGNYQYSSFDPTLPNADAGGLAGALIFPGPGAGRTGLKRNYPTDFSSVGPRAGFAWRVGEKTVLRGGFGVYYQTLGNGGCGCTLGFSGSPAQATSDGLNAALQWDGGIPIPPGFAAPPFIDPTFGNGQNVEYLGPNFGQAPRYYNWSFSVQREFKNFLVDISYLGNRGSGLNSSIPINQVDPSRLPLGSLLSQNINAPAVVAAGFSEPFDGFAQLFGSSATLAQALRPYPQYVNVTHRNSGDGKVWYEAVQAKLERRFGDLQFNANYTFSKSLSALHFRQIFTQFETIAQNAYDLGNEKSVSPFDLPHKFNVLAFIDMPFGRGKRYLGSSNRGADLLVGGWQVGVILEYFSGSVFAANAPNTLGNGVLFAQSRRPNLGSQPISTGVDRTELDPDNPNVRWFNQGAFAIPANGFEFGSASRYLSDFRQPPFFRDNFSIVKRFNMFEVHEVPVRTTSSTPLTARTSPLTEPLATPHLGRPRRRSKLHVSSPWACASNFSAFSG